MYIIDSVNNGIIAATDNFQKAREKVITEALLDLQGRWASKTTLDQLIQLTHFVEDPTDTELDDWYYIYTVPFLE